MKKIILAFLGWRILIMILAIFSFPLIPLRTGFLGGGQEVYQKAPFLWGWANMDGIHYLSIAKNGYMQYEQAFFPLYPLIIRFLGNLFGGNFLLAGLIISNISFFIGCGLFYRLLKLENLEKNVHWIFLLLFLFPTSFFFGSIYTEGLFFLLIISSFYCMRKAMWWQAGIIGALAAATRLVGIFLLPALIIEIWQCNRISKGGVFPPKQFNNESMKQLLSIIILPLGLLLYMGYLFETTGDPLFFFHAQPMFGANRSGSNIILLPQVIYRYLKIFFTAGISYDYFISLFEFLSFFFAGYLLLKNIKKLRISYQLFSWLCLLTPALTGSFSSVPRYITTIFPLYIAYSYENKITKSVIIIISAILLFLATGYYFRGYFVS